MLSCLTWTAETFAILSAGRLSNGLNETKQVTVLFQVIDLLQVTVHLQVTVLFQVIDLLQVTVHLQVTYFTGDCSFTGESFLQ
ncbi:hypothetical protein BgiMline_002807, partial [Biomphalaria glabrata]